MCSMEANSFLKPSFKITCIYLMGVSVLPTWMSAHLCMSSAHGDQKRALDGLKLELRMVVSHHVDAEDQTQGLCKNKYL